MILNTMWNQIRNSSNPSVWLLWRWLLTVCLDADALIKTLFPGLVLTPKMKISPGYEMTTNLRFHAVIGRHIILVVFIAETAVQVWNITLLFLKVVKSRIFFSLWLKYPPKSCRIIPLLDSAQDSFWHLYLDIWAKVKKLSEIYSL